MSGYQYWRARFWKSLQNPIAHACPALPLEALDRHLVTNDLPPLVSAVVNGIQRRRCRRSKLTAELGYEFDLLCILFTYDSEHKANAMLFTTYEIDPYTKNLH